MEKKMIKRVNAKIRYGYLFKARLRLRLYRLHITRRVLWRLYGGKAVYKPYKDLRGNGSGWAGRFIWRGRVLCYVTKRGVKWF